MKKGNKPLDAEVMLPQENVVRAGDVNTTLILLADSATELSFIPKSDKMQWTETWTACVPAVFWILMETRRGSSADTLKNGRFGLSRLLHGEIWELPASGENSCKEMVLMEKNTLYLLPRQNRPCFRPFPTSSSCCSVPSSPTGK